MPRPREPPGLRTTIEAGILSLLERRQAEAHAPLRVRAVARVRRAHRDRLGLAREERDVATILPSVSCESALTRPRKNGAASPRRMRHEAADGHALATPSAAAAGARRPASRRSRAQFSTVKLYSATIICWVRSRDAPEHLDVLLLLARELALLVGLLEGLAAGHEEVDLGQAEDEARGLLVRDLGAADAAARPRTRACAGACSWSSASSGRASVGSPRRRGLLVRSAGRGCAGGCSWRAGQRRARGGWASTSPAVQRARADGPVDVDRERQRSWASPRQASCAAPAPCAPTCAAASRRNPSAARSSPTGRPPASAPRARRSPPRVDTPSSPSSESLTRSSRMPGALGRQRSAW